MYSNFSSISIFKLYMNNNKIDVILFNKVVYQRYSSELIGLIEYSFLCCIIIYSFLYPKEYYQTA